MDPFVSRTPHHIDLATIGAYLAVSVGLGGALGSWLGVRYSDALRRRDIRWSLWMLAVLFIGSLRYALVVMQVVGIWSGLHYGLAGRYLDRAPSA